MSKLHMNITDFRSIECVELDITYKNPCTKQIEYDENGDPKKKKMILTTRDIVTMVCYANIKHNEKDIILVKGRIMNIAPQMIKSKGLFGADNSFKTLLFTIDNSKQYESSSIEVSANNIIDIVYVHQVGESVDEPFVNIEDYLKPIEEIDVAMPPDAYDNEKRETIVPNGLVISD